MYNSKNIYKIWQHSTEDEKNILFYQQTSSVLTGWGRFGRDKGTGKVGYKKIIDWKIASNRYKTIRNKGKLRVLKLNEIVASSQFKQLSTIIC